MNFLKLKLNHQMLIKYQQNGLKQGVGQFVLRYKIINSAWNEEITALALEGVKH
jgi:hypothetical protein